MKTLLQTLLDAQGGCHLHAAWISTVKPAAAHKGVELEKRVTGAVRVGISFANLGTVANAVASGDRDAPGPLPWGEWVDGAINRVITHHGRKYARFYPATGGKQLATVYLVDGEEVSKEDFAAYLPPAKARDLLGGGKPRLCFNIPFDSLEELG